MKDETTEMECENMTNRILCDDGMYREVVNGKERELAETMEDFCPKCGEPLVWMASVRKYRACKCGKKGKKRG